MQTLTDTIRSVLGTPNIVIDGIDYGGTKNTANCIS